MKLLEIRNDLLELSKISFDEPFYPFVTRYMTLLYFRFVFPQASLDFTYVDENLLVEEEFSQSSSDERIRKVFGKFFYEKLFKLPTSSLNHPQAYKTDYYIHVLFS